MPGLCLLVPCLLLGLDLAIHVPGDGLSSFPPALLATLWVPLPPKPSSLLGPSFCCNKEQSAGISQERSGHAGCSSSVLLPSKS